MTKGLKRHHQRKELPSLRPLFQWQLGQAGFAIYRRAALTTTCICKIRLSSHAQHTDAVRHLDL